MNEHCISQFMISPLHWYIIKTLLPLHSPTYSTLLLIVMNAHSLNMCAPSHSIYFPGQALNTMVSTTIYMLMTSKCLSQIQSSLLSSFLICLPGYPPKSNKLKSELILFKPKSALPLLLNLSEITFI